MAWVFLPLLSSSPQSRTTGFGSGAAICKITPFATLSVLNTTGLVSEFAQTTEWLVGLT
jgi:hypothetical protein